MLKRNQKDAQIKEIQEKFSKSKATIFTNYKGLSVEKITELRKSLRKVDADYKVYKNTLSYLAYKNSGVEDTEKYFTGATAIAFTKKDPAELAKILSEFQKQNEIFNVKGGTLGNKIISEQDVKVLASLPSKEVLIGKLLGSIQAPLYGLVNALAGNIRNLCYTLKAIEEQKAKAA